jgi:hypothetical protein
MNDPNINDRIFREIVLVEERKAINARRARSGRPDFGQDVKPVCWRHLASQLDADALGNAPQAALGGPDEPHPVRGKLCAPGRAAAAGDSDPSDHGNYIGLAHSGGGIRSATFALGVQQALAASGLLKYFDYLSTASGGGYIGSSLTWFLREDAVGEPAGRSPDTCRRSRAVAYDLDAEGFPFGSAAPDDVDGDDACATKYLRANGNYLTPDTRISLLSGVAIMLRAILLNLLVWVPLLILLSTILWTKIGCVASGDASGDAAASCALSWLGPVGRLVASAHGPSNVYLTLSDVLLMFSIVPAGIVLIWCVLYSLCTPFQGGISVPFVRRFSRYDWRRGFEIGAKMLLKCALVLFGVGILFVMVSWAYAHFASSTVTGVVAVVSGIAGAVAKYSGVARAIPSRIALPIAAGLVLLAVVLLTCLMGRALGPAPWATLTDAWLGLQPAGQTDWTTWRVFLGVVGLAFVSGYCANVNHLSPHRYYRDRLMETFLPSDKAVRDNRPGPSREADEAPLSGFTCRNSPYHIINTNVVLVDSETRKYRRRGGDSFILSPLFCGSRSTAWVCTKTFMDDKLTLATAMAISGAAANPNSGPPLVRNRLVSWLMALLNIRLGYWIPNYAYGLPALHAESPDRIDAAALRVRYRRRRRWFNHFNSMRFELGVGFGPANGFQETKPWLQIADGGHFENLAIYELIRRRLRLIVVTDGGADEKYTFEDLQNAIHRVAEDFGAKIAFERPFWMPDQPGHCSRPWRNRLADMVPRDLEGFPLDVKYAEFGFIIGTINYGPAAGGVAGGAPDYGIIILMKTTMLSGLSIATRGYKGANPDFPDETTADQFFDEYQFEAYRALGYRTAEQMIEGAQLARLIHTIRQVAA